MFDNIGSTIKTLAKIMLWSGVIGSIVLGFVLLFNGTLWGPLFIVIGGFFSILGASLVYGFGQLIENSDVLAERCQYSTNRSHKEHSQNT